MVDAEIAALGACLIDPQAYWRVADILRAEDFTGGGHRRIFTLIAEMAGRNDARDAVTLGERDPRIANLAIEIANAAFSSANVLAYAGIVARKSLERRVRAAGTQITHMAGDDVYGDAQRALAACAPQSRSQVRHVKEFVRDAFVQMQTRLESTEELTGIPTGLPWLDEATSGLQPGDLAILAARPSVGKTALAVQIAIHAARSGHPTFFSSLEMSGTRVAHRVQSHLSRVSTSHIRDPKRLTSGELEDLFDVQASIASMPLFVDESSSLPVEAMCARARQQAATEGLGLWVIDYLQYIAPPKAATTADAIQVVTRSLKALAKEHKAVILLLSQLNRDGEGQRPGLKHLRDSGAIEQDADLVAFLHRPDPKARHLVELILAKQRDGEVGEIMLHADMASMRFTETDERPQLAENATGGFTGAPVRRVQRKRSGVSTHPYGGLDD